MEMKPRLTVSGYRGIWGKDLDENKAFEYTLSFAKMLKFHGDPHSTKIIVGRDARKSGPEILRAVETALKREGYEMKYIGIIPTPSLLFLVKKLFGRGGIIVTASHNPKEYNGLKFVMEGGRFTNQAEVDKIEKIRVNLNIEEKKYEKDKNKKIEELDNKKYRDIHIFEVLKHVKAAPIINRRFKVVLDPINSAGAKIAPDFLQKLGCEVVVINGEQSGEFTHEPEPIQKNLISLGKKVLEEKADLGFALDPDADRLVLVNEQGEVISEECTLALAVKNVLLKRKTDVVINMSTSSMCEDLAQSYRRNIFRTKIGEANVVEKMEEIGAEIGGEGNGGVIFPTVHPCRDSITGMGLILELLAHEHEKLSKIVEKLPRYIMRKDKMPYQGNLEMLYWQIKNEFQEATINTLDGVRFDWADGSWIHIRPSNTEPIIRIIGEAKTKERIEYLFDKVRLTLETK